EVVREFRHKDEVVAVAYSLDGKRILTGSRDRSAGLWDVGTGARLREISDQLTVSAVAFSPDSKTGLTSSADGVVKFWDAVDGADLDRTLSNNKEPIYAVAISPDGKTMVIGGHSKVSLWNVRDGSPIGQPVSTKCKVACVAFGRDGETVLARWSDDSMRL